MFSHMKFQIRINIFHVSLLQLVWFTPHLPSLINLEKLTSNFGQFVKIFYWEKEKEDIMAIGKLFALHANAKTPETYKQTSSNKKGNS